jgi:hypothetical protein
LPSPVPPWLQQFRRTLAARGSAETLRQFRRLARQAGTRAQAVCEVEFDAIFDDRGVSSIVGAAYEDLFDGGLASFRGRCDADLVAFVEDRTDRVVLRAVVAEWADHEVRAARAARWSDLIGAEETDELASEARAELLARALVAFRGDSAGELYSFVRTVAHRTVSRAVRRHLRDRGGLRLLRAQQDRPAPTLVLPFEPRLAHADSLPISDSDRAYLEELFRLGGSKSNLARQRGVDRSAVTRMVQRILTRLDDLSADDRSRVGEWARDVAASAEADRLRSASS